MIKGLRRIVLFILLIASIPSCNLLEDCKTCKLVTDNGVDPPTKGVGIPTCGDALDKRMAEDPVTIDGVTTYWECK